MHSCDGFLQVCSASSRNRLHRIWRAFHFRYSLADGGGKGMPPADTRPTEVSLHVGETDDTARTNSRGETYENKKSRGGRRTGSWSSGGMGCSGKFPVAIIGTDPNPPGPTSICWACAGVLPIKAHTRHDTASPGGRLPGGASVIPNAHSAHMSPASSTALG
jgi:hypothetical protein